MEFTKVGIIFGLKRAQKGFTLVELMVATSVFSVFLLILTMIIVQISRTYTKGLISSKTQETARAISAEIAKSIQLSGGDITLSPAVPTPGIPYTLCAGTQRYTFVVGRQLKTSPTASDHSSNVLVADEVGVGCPAGTLGISNPQLQRELLGENMRLANLSVTQVGISNLYSVKVRVAYGDTDGLEEPADSPTVLCKNIQSTSQFCSVSELTATVQRRLN
jgi:prepilin-type N-terminal cleavage/methylation domain-containing protein